MKETIVVTLILEEINEDKDFYLRRGLYNYIPTMEPSFTYHCIANKCFHKVGVGTTIVDSRHVLRP